MPKRPVKIPDPEQPHRRIPPSAARVHDPQDPEVAALRISYRHYRDDLCEMEDLNQAEAKGCLQSLRRIGKHTQKTFYTQNVDIGVTQVEKLGQYKKFFTKLTDDVELKEHRLSQTSRVIYFLQNTDCHIVAILHSHTETDKNRR